MHTTERSVPALAKKFCQATMNTPEATPSTTEPAHATGICATPACGATQRSTSPRHMAAPSAQTTRRSMRSR
ncbi:hypothetical protein AAY81_08380 [Denitrobacterium detoxificans]|nr:hypothetical protein AAY81_08380 [Denitrobacterium detoxificans]